MLITKLEALGLLVSVPLVFGAPFTPAGGVGTGSTPPVYHPASDFDFQSLVRFAMASFNTLFIQGIEFGAEPGMD
jgi:hypothetical protein